jgi:hypothetical protein
MPRLAFTGLAVSELVLGAFELARGRTVPALVLIGAALVSGLVWGARGGVPPVGARSGEETERAKSSAISRWRSRS